MESAILVVPTKEQGRKARPMQTVKKIIDKLGLGLVFTIIFAALKVFGVISWSWVWITATFWGSFLLVAVLFTVSIILKLSIATLESKK